MNPKPSLELMSKLFILFTLINQQAHAEHISSNISCEVIHTKIPERKQHKNPNFYESSMKPTSLIHSQITITTNSQTPNLK